MATERLELVLFIETPSQNDWQTWHFGKRQRWKKRASRLLRATLALQGIHEPTHGLRGAIVAFHSYRWQLLDYGNLVGGCKGLLDEVVHAGLLVDDSPKWIEERYTQSVDRKKRRTTISITYTEASC